MLKGGLGGFNFLVKHSKDPKLIELNPKVVGFAQSMDHLKNLRNTWWIQMISLFPHEILDPLVEKAREPPGSSLDVP
jgi:hypothetical protein